MIESLKKNKFLLNILIILTFVILSFSSVYLLLKNHNIYIANDMQFHFKRIIELKKTLIHGSLLSYFSFNEFHGSAVMSMYPYFNLLPIVLLSFIIKSQINLIYFSFLLNILLTFIISFYSSKDYVESYLSSYVFSIIYSLSNTFVFCNFITYDQGIVYTYMLLPLIIFAFLKIINGNNNWIQLSVGMSLLLYSHILNFCIVSIFLLIFFLLNINKLNRKISLNIFKSIILFILLTGIILVPFIQIYVNNINKINLPPMNLLRRGSIKKFLLGLIGDGNDETIGFFPIISLFISVIFYKHFNRYIKQLYVLSVIIVFIVLFLPWNFMTSYLTFLNQIQFIYRLYVIPNVILSFIFSLIITKYINSLVMKNIIYYCTIFIAIFLQIFVGQYSIVKKISNNPSINNYLYQNSNYLNRSNILNLDANNLKGWNGFKIETSKQFNRFMNSYSGMDNDYIPKSAFPMALYVNSNLGFYNDYHQLKVNNIGYNTFNFSGRKGINKISLPIYAYNKEKLHVYLNDKPVNNYADNGLLTMSNIKDSIKPNNKVYIKTISNPFKTIISILSIFVWLFVLIVLIQRIFIK